MALKDTIEEIVVYNQKDKKDNKVETNNDNNHKDIQGEINDTFNQCDDSM